jgi:mannose-6-phosphate isomerase-like protein (cupin superfamily)
MIVKSIEDSIGGWYVGNFPNAAYQTKSAEVSFKTHKAGEKWGWHYHEHLDEINLLVSGSMTIQGVLLYPGNVFILSPMEIADPVFHEDCEIVCVKLPNFTNDKIIVKRDQ